MFGHFSVATTTAKASTEQDKKEISKELHNWPAAHKARKNFQAGKVFAWRLIKVHFASV